jgi:hypothetical protein
MYDEMKKTNETNLESIKGMKQEFVDEAEYMEKKFEALIENNPFI